MTKKPKTMRERARALAQECVLFGKLQGSQWDGLTELFVAFAENEIRLLAEAVPVVSGPLDNLVNRIAEDEAQYAHDSDGIPPHDFVGRVDRPCERCHKADRNPVHAASQP